MSEVEIQKKNNEELAKCFDFWNDTPVIKELESHTYDQVIEASPRVDILDILVEGIEEKHPTKKRSKIKRRRALSATEIFDRLNGNDKKGIKARLAPDERIQRNNLYFHLDKLTEVGVLEDIATTSTGRRTTTYFGRTAKIVIPQKTDKRSDTDLLLHPDFVEFVKRINPTINEKDLDQILALADRKNDYTQFDDVKNWLTKHEEKTRDLELDLRKLLNFISIIVRYDDKAIEGLNRIGEILGIDEIKNMRKDM